MTYDLEKTLNEPIQSSPVVGKKRHEEHVHMNFRYSCAWQEYNQRMIARHHIINLYMTVSSVALAFLYSHRSEKGFNFWEVALVLPVASLIASMLLYMHDCMMANLHDYLISCELYNNRQQDSINFMPSYHGTRQSAELFLKNRHLQNYTIILIFFIFNVGPFYFLQGSTRLEVLLSSHKWFFYLLSYISISMISWVLILEGQDRRKEPAVRQFGDCDVPAFHQRSLIFLRRILSKYLHLNVLIESNYKNNNHL